MAGVIEGLDQARVTLAPDRMPAYSWRGVCRVTDCGRPATEPHEILPRGRVGGVVSWIVIDGQPWANRMGICRRHHDRITEGFSHIEWRDHADPVGWWYRSPARFVPLLPLGCSEGIVAAGGKHCPHCGQTQPRPNPYGVRRREQQGVRINAPTDLGENGPEVLDSLLQAGAAKLGFDLPESVMAGQANVAAYHVITAALAGFVLDDGPARSLAAAVRANGNGA